MQVNLRPTGRFILPVRLQMFRAGGAYAFRPVPRASQPEYHPSKHNASVIFRFLRKCYTGKAQKIFQKVLAIGIPLCDSVYMAAHNHLGEHHER